MIFEIFVLPRVIHLPNCIAHRSVAGKVYILVYIYIYYILVLLLTENAS